MIQIHSLLAQERAKEKPHKDLAENAIAAEKK